MSALVCDAGARRGEMHYIACMTRPFAFMAFLAGMSVLSAPAFAQLDTLPRFEALEQQLQTAEQRHLDQLETQRQRERLRSTQPNSGVSVAEQALRDMEYRRERDRLLLQGEQDRQRVQRERDLANAALLNARVPVTSTAVVTSPEAYLLPPAPPGKYYARVEGRFVLVDETSELVTSILPVQPTDPTTDVPTGPRPMPDRGLPVRRVASGSSLVIHDPATFALPPAPGGQYYARVDGLIVLVDQRTEMPVKVVTGG
jgi:Ni/Co efflux regulator RcnB